MSLDGFARAPAASSLDPASPLVDELWRAARVAWPEVDLPRDAFCAHLSARLPETADPAQALREMRTADLYLACACARGDLRAIASLERRCLPVIDETLARMTGLTSDIADDVKQRLRRALLVADGRPPRILEFSGRGELRRWLRIMAVREALAIRHRARRDASADDDVLERALVPAADPEMEYFKRLYQDAFTRAVSEALRALPAREQVLLRQCFVDDLSIDELGRFYQVHRATAARWLVRAQSALARETHAILMQRLTVNPAELRSILRMIRSGLELSLRLVFPARRRRKPCAP